MITVELKQILLDLNIGNDKFFTFLKRKVVTCNIETKYIGTFPITNKDGILIDIRVLVPIIKDKETLKQNIHEFAHAFELYKCLGKTYIENIEESEKYAISKEEEYARKLSLLNKTK